MYDFSKRKFLNLPIQKQHKKCADLLRNIYDQWMHSKEWMQSWQIYQQFLQWMNEPTCNSPTLKDISDLYHHHREKALIFKKEHHLLPQIREGDRFFAEEPWSIAIYLDNLRSAHNVGSIIRTVEAFSLGSIYFSSKTPFVTNKQVMDAAMGSSQWVSCYKDANLETLPQPIIVLETSDQALSLYEFDFPLSFTLVVGNEEYGCSSETLRLADYLIEIPLRGHKNSLNVANALAIVASEINRQKKSMNRKEKA